MSVVCIVCHGRNQALIVLDKRISEVLANQIFKRIYADNWGPRTDDVLKSCLLTLVSAPESTLADERADLFRTLTRESGSR